MKLMKSIVSGGLIFLMLAGITPNVWANEIIDQVGTEGVAEQTDETQELETLTTFEATEIPDYENSIENQVVVVYKDAQETIEGLNVGKDNVVAGQSISDRVDVLELKDNETAEQIINELSKNPNVLAVERNATIEATSLPDDPYILDGTAWQFKKIGSDLVWDQVENTDEVIVAVIDTGLNTAHPDLTGRIVQGFDYMTSSPAVIDLSGHGTMVSGCIAATVNNGIGMAGSAGGANVKIAPYRTGGQYSGDKSLYISHIAAAIMDAADRSDVQIINMSFGTYSEFASIRSSVEYAVSKGKVLVASAGNEGTMSSAGDYAYPASYDGVISVAATNRYDEHPTFSQYNDKVDLSAPGSSIITTTKSGSYGTASGTSFSAPVVSGACAYLMAADPSLSATEVENVLKETALDLGESGKDDYFGYGRIQLDKAFEAVNGIKPLAGISLDQDSISLLEGKSRTIIVSYNPVNTTDSRTVLWSSSDPAVASVDENGSVTGISEGLAVITATVGDFEASCQVNVVLDPVEIGITYQTHVQNRGWQNWVNNGEISGTTGEALRLEGIHVEIDDNGSDVGVRYQTHVENIGWMDWVQNGQLSGTTGKSLRLEGIRIELTGADAELWDVYYQVHAQNFGWLDLVKNGDPSGTEGFACRLEGIRIIVVPKGDPEPLAQMGSSDQGFVKKEK